MYSRQGCLLSVCAIISALVLAGCASGRKQKLEQREKLAASSGLYCDFVNGDKNKEVELELNVLMAKKCDSDRPFSITNYKTPAEVTGVLYCCAVKKAEAKNSSDLDDYKLDTAKPTMTPVAPAKKEDPKPALKPDAKDLKPAAKPDAKTAPATSTPSTTTTTTPSKGQPSVDKKPTQPQDNKSNSTKDSDDDIVPL